MKTRWLPAMALAAAFVFTMRVSADYDVKLPINGDFRGRAAGYSPAPGWTLTADGGNARILPTRMRNDFMLELSAAPNRSQSVVSNLHRLPGDLLKLEIKVRGTGTASAGYEVFEHLQRPPIASDSQSATLSTYDQKVKRYFRLPPKAKYIRIRLTAEAGSVARFRGIEADVTFAPAEVSQPAPGAVPPPPPPAPALALGPIAVPPPPPPAPDPATASPVASVQAPRPPRQPLQNDRYYPCDSLGPHDFFETSQAVGSAIGFGLGEDPAAGLNWQVAVYDPRICRVRLEHGLRGIFPFRQNQAEIELKAIGRGTTDVVFTCGKKKITVRFSAE